MEQLACWSLVVLNFILFETRYKERVGNVAIGDDGLQPVIERLGPLLSQQNDPRLILRAAFLMQQDYGSSAYPTDWSAVRELTTGEPPVSFLNSSYSAP
ncbi:MAG: hypothetical protein AAFR12_05310 [Cyanobacteria bacterium J06626_6]